MKSEQTSKRAASVDTAATVDQATIVSGAKRLADAAASGVTRTPVRDLIGPDDIASAYLMQEGFNARRYAGSTVVGRKIVATSKAVQDQLGVDQPDFGVLYAEMEYHEDDVIALDVLLQPKVEAEVAFMLSGSTR
ncbi:hypothetical protein [Streptomyces sp. NPDC046862]|uniref:hypothetical protein n=1 Tax=Streptomyces sp. NPDC046862 TaxID=3154603 RepID=UPI003454F758